MKYIIIIIAMLCSLPGLAQIQVLEEQDTTVQIMFTLPHVEYDTVEVAPSTPGADPYWYHVHVKTIGGLRYCVQIKTSWPRKIGIIDPAGDEMNAEEIEAFAKKYLSWVDGNYRIMHYKKANQVNLGQ